MNYENRDSCYYHPKQTLVGVCPLCLYDRLIAVAAQEARRSKVRPRLLRRRSYHGGGAHTLNASSNAGVKKIFAFTSLLNRLELRHRRRRSNDIASDYQSTSTSLEDSFISIKFENNGVASWDKAKHKFTKTNPKGIDESNANPKKATNGVVEHTKTAMRWRKRIGHLLQLVKWKKPSSGSGGTGTGTAHVDGVVNARSKGWIRTLTRRRRTSKE